jgi:hypothetical protein
VNHPTFALTIPNPWALLILKGFRRDWTVDVDPGLIRGQAVAIHVAAEGDHDGYRCLAKWWSGPGPVPKHADVYAEAPRSCIAGVVIAAEVVALPGRWRVALVAPRQVLAVGPVDPGDLALWPLPASRRAELAAQLRTGRAA